MCAFLSAMSRRGRDWPPVVTFRTFELLKPHSSNRTLLCHFFPAFFSISIFNVNCIDSYKPSNKASSKQPHHPFGAGSLNSGPKRIPTPSRSPGTGTDLLVTTGGKTSVGYASATMSPRASPSFGGPVRVPVSPDTPQGGTHGSHHSTGLGMHSAAAATGGPLEDNNNKKLPWETSSLKVGMASQQQPPPSSSSVSKSPRPRSPRLGSPRASTGVGSATSSSHKATSPRAAKPASATKTSASVTPKAAVTAPSGKVIAAKVMANVTAARSPPPSAAPTAAPAAAAAAPKLASPVRTTTAPTKTSSPVKSPSTIAKKRGTTPASSSASSKHAFFHAAMVSPTDFGSPLAAAPSGTAATAPEMSFMRSTASSRASSYTAMLAAAEGPTHASTTTGAAGATTAAGAMQSPARSKKSPSKAGGQHSPMKSPKSNKTKARNHTSAQLAPPSPSPPSPVAPSIASLGATIITPSPEQVHDRYSENQPTASSFAAVFTSPMSNPAAALADVLNDEFDGFAQEAFAAPATLVAHAQENQHQQHQQHQQQEEETHSSSPPLSTATTATTTTSLPFRASPFGHSRSGGDGHSDVRDEGSISPISRIRPPRASASSSSNAHASTPTTSSTAAAASPAPFAAKASPYRCKPSPTQGGFSSSSSPRPTVAAAIATMSPARLPPPPRASSANNGSEAENGPLVPSPRRPSNLHAASSLDASAEVRIVQQRKSKAANEIS